MERILFEYAEKPASSSVQAYRSFYTFKDMLLEKNDPEGRLSLQFMKSSRIIQHF